MKKHFKKAVSFVIALALVIGMIPFTAITSYALGEVLSGTYWAEAGETTTVTCLGGAAYQQTHFSISCDTVIGKVTKYNSDGTVDFEKDIFGGYSYTDTSCLKDEKFVFDIYYGSVKIYFTTSNVGYPALEKVANNKSLVPPIKLNENPIYITLGETQDLFIEWTQQDYTSEVTRFRSDDSKVASISEDGVITANCEGEALISVDYKFTNANNQSLSLTEECPVYVVDDEVDKNTGLRFYYSHEEIEPGDKVYIGADYTYGNFTGMYYPGKVEWVISNENVLKIVNSTENITSIIVEALALGECEISLVLDGEVKCTDIIDVTITDDTLISEYKDYLLNSGVMTTLDNARATCWDVIDRYSSADRTRIAFLTCLKSDLGLSVITKESMAALGITTSTHQDTVDEAIDLLMTEICSSQEAWFSDGLSTFKKRYKNYGAFTKTTAFTESSFESALAQFTSFSEEQIDSVCEVANDFVGDGISMAELVSGAVMTVQYERDTVTALMTAVAAAPGGQNSDLFKGLERLLWEMDNLDTYVAHRFLNEKLIDSLKGLIKDGFLFKDDNFKLFDKTVWKVASGIGQLIALSYEMDGGIFADDYMKACVTSGFAATLCNAVKNSNNATDLEYTFKFYVPAVKVALNSAIDICEDAYVNCLDLKGIAEGYLVQIDATCTYENLLNQCRQAVKGASDFKSNVYMEDDEIKVDAYWELPQTYSLMIADGTNGDFYTNGYANDQLIVVPSHINGEKVNGIAANGFQGITNKYGIVLPNSVERIGNYAFADCPQVTFVSMGNNVKEIGAYAFANNFALQSVNFPTSIEVIKEGAFSNCNNISAIITEANQIGSKAFNNCAILSSVTIKNKTAQISADAFDNCSSSLVIYGYKNSTAEELATAKGYTFVELGEVVSDLSIDTPATKTEYEVGETISTDGLSLKVTYTDGTSEVITDGWIAYGDTTKSGETTVKVYYGEKVITYTIVVTDTEPDEVELNFTNLEMLFGTDIQLTANILPDNSPNKRIIWASSNNDVATVDVNGYVEAISTGSAIITAKVLGTDVKAECTIVVTDTKTIIPANTEVTNITFTARENGYYVFYTTDSTETVDGYIEDINGNILYSNRGTNFRVEGQLHKDKTYIFRAETDSTNSNFNLVINKSVVAETVAIKDNKNNAVSEITGFPTDREQLNFDFTPVNYISEECSWESADTTVATVDEDGLVYMVAPGTTTITVKSENGLTDTCTVKVKEYTEATEIKVGETKTVVIEENDDTQHFKFTPEKDGWYVFYSKEDANGNSHYGTLKESDGTYIKGGINYYANEVYVEYEFTAGVTYILQTGYVSSWDTGSFELCLEELPATESIIIVEGDSFEDYAFNRISLTAKTSPDMHIPDKITWSSDNTTVATVSSSDEYGYVTLKSPGTATITVSTASGLTDTCQVTVKPFTPISLNETKTVEIDSENRYGYFSFTPDEDGWYTLYSISDIDTYGTLYNTNGSQLTYDYDSGTDDNFRIEYEMTAGTTYIFRTTLESSTANNSFDVKLEKMIPAESISITQGNNLSGYKNTSISLTIDFAPVDCIEETITWTSDNTTVATVSSYGYVNLLSIGEATITATSESGLTATCKVQVTDYPTIYVGEQKTVEHTTLKPNEYYYFTPEHDGTYVFYSVSETANTYGHIYDINGTQLKYDNNSGDGNNFRIQYDMTAGVTYVLRSRIYSGNTKTYDICLIELVDAQAVEITQGDSVSGILGTSQQLTAELSPENSRDQSMTWTSSDEDIVYVDNTGYIQLLSVGEATITVTTESGLTDTCVVTVEDYPEIALDTQETVNITENNTFGQFRFIPSVNGKYKVNINSEYYTEVYITTADGEYITSNTGYEFTTTCNLVANTVYYISTSYWYYDDYGTHTILVTKMPSAASMEIGNGDTVVGYVGESLHLWTSFKPSDAASESVSWISDNTSVATVSDGYVTFVSSGTATITATSERGLTDTITITVKEVLDIALDEDEVIEFTNVNDNVRYKFTPTETGPYLFERSTVWTSDDDSSSCDVRILDENGNTLGWLYSSKNLELVAGNDYYIDIRNYSNIGTLTLGISKNVAVESLEILSNPTKMDYYDFEDYLDYSGLKVRVTFDNGTTVDWDSENGGNLLGYELSVDNYYGDYTWGELSSYTNTIISCGEITVDFQYNVLPNPVDRIEINTAPTRTYVYGDTQYGSMDSDGDYYFEPDDLTGLSFTVYFNDGTHKVYTHNDIDPDEWQTIDGFNYELSYDSYNPQIGDFPITFTYMGTSVDYTVPLQKSTVSSIAVTKAPNTMEYSDWYSADLIGMEVTITYADSTTKVVTLSEDNIEYDSPYYYSSDVVVRVKVDDYYLVIEAYYDYDSKYYFIDYLGATCDYKDITFTEAKEVSSVEIKNASENGDGMVVKITYADQTTDNLVFDTVFNDTQYSDDTISENVIIAKTDNGIISYWLTVYYDDNGEIEKYSYWMFGNEVEVDATVSVLAGDVNGDGKITPKDVTDLRRYLAGGWSVTIDLTAADVNGNGKITPKDVTDLRRYLAGGWGVALG